MCRVSHVDYIRYVLNVQAKVHKCNLKLVVNTGKGNPIGQTVQTSQGRNQTRVKQGYGQNTEAKHKARL